MAVFTETIKLDDQVSAPAKAASDTVLSFTERMKAGKLAAAAARAENAALGDALNKVAAPTKKAAGEFENLTAAMLREQKAAGTGKVDASNLAKATKQAAKDQEGLTAVTNAGTAAMEGYALAAVAAIGALVVGFTALVVAGAKFAIEASEAKQQMLGLFDAMGGGIVTGEETEAMIDGLKAKFGIAKDSMVQWTNELMRMGRTDLSQMEGDLLALASAAALVKGGDAALLELTKKIDLASEAGIGLKIPTKALAQLSATGANVGDVAAAMGVSVTKLTADLAAGTVDAKKFGIALNDAIVKKGAGPLEKFANSSANIKQLFLESMGDLFEDIDVGPFMKEVKDLFAIFSQAPASGQALKAGIGGFFKDVFAAATKVVPLVKHFMLDLVIYGLKAYISLKPIIKWFEEMAAKKQTIDMLVNAFKILGAVVAVTVGVLGAIIATVALLAYGFVAGVAGIIDLGMALYGVVDAIDDFIGGAAIALYEWIAGAPQVAMDFVMGLVNGIASGDSLVIGAVSGLAGAALGALTSAFDSHSPSRLTMGVGGDVGDGLAIGMTDKEETVHGAASGLAGAAVQGVTGGGDGAAGGAAAAGGGAVTINVQIDGAGKSAQEITDEMIATSFQRMAMQAGV